MTVPASNLNLLHLSSLLCYTKSMLQLCTRQGREITFASLPGIEFRCGTVQAAYTTLLITLEATDCHHDYQLCSGSLHKPHIVIFIKKMLFLTAYHTGVSHTNSTSPCTGCSALVFYSCNLILSAIFPCYLFGNEQSVL